MKVFFTCSRNGSKIEKYYRQSYQVLQELKRLKVSVESTLEKSYLNGAPDLKRVKDLSINESDFKYVHDTSVRQAIRRNDAMIIEASYPSFRLGFEAFYALSIKKPVLVLSASKNYAGLISQPHFFGAKYTDFTLPDIIEKFIKHIRQYKLGTRFNLFISQAQKQKLDLMSRQYHVSQSDYLRGLVDKD
jgi:hypothetical protein